MQYITNAFDQIRDISYVFNFSEQRQKKLTKIVKGLCNESFKAKLLDVCITRWMERENGLDVFQQLVVEFVTIFEDISDHLCNNDN